MSKQFKTFLVRCESCNRLFDINDAPSVRMYGGFGEGFEDLFSGITDKVFVVCPGCGEENYAGTESTIFGDDGTGMSVSNN